MPATSFTGSYGYLNYLNEIQRPYEKEIALSYIKANGVGTKVGKPHTEGAMLRRKKRAIDHLPAVNSANLNGTLATPSYQTYEDYSESVAYIRDNQPYDHAFLTDKNYVDGNPVSKQIEAYMNARNFYKDNVLINNSKTQGSIADPKMVNGIKYRLMQPQQTGSGCNSACWFQGSADLSTAGITSTQGLIIAQNFQRMMSHMGNPKGTGMILLLSPQAMWQLDLVIKNQGQAGGFTTSKDAFDRSVVMFKDLEISECGFLAPQDGGLQTAPIISNGQDANGLVAGDPGFNSTGAVYTTGFFIQTSGPEPFSLWCHKAPWMWEGYVPGTYNHIVMYEESIGIWQPYTRSIGGLYGIKTNGPTGD